MVNNQKFNSLSGKINGSKSSRIGVKNKPKRILLNNEILKVLHLNKGNINELFRATLKENPVKGLELFIAMAELVIKEEK